MNAPETDIAAASPGLPLDAEGEPVFFAPWQAKAFAMTLTLYEKGTFTWPEWAEALGRACARDSVGSGDSAQEHAEAYFTAWLKALEGLLAASRIVSAEIVEETARTWQRAAEATPHGTPIRYEAGLRSPK